MRLSHGLDRHFQQLNAGPCSEFAFMGNEVSLKTPWMYAFAGAPWKTQEVVRRILLELYSNSPAGMPGNDDGGVLSSWVVLASDWPLSPDLRLWVDSW